MVVLRKVLMGLLENTFAHITYIQMHIRQRTRTFAASWCMSLRQVGLPSMKNFFIMEWNQPLKVGFIKMRPKENYWEEWLWATQHSCSNIILANARGVCTDNSDPMWFFFNSLRVGSDTSDGCMETFLTDTGSIKWDFMQSRVSSLFPLAGWMWLSKGTLLPCETYNQKDFISQFLLQDLRSSATD